MAIEYKALLNILSKYKRKNVDTFLDYLHLRRKISEASTLVLTLVVNGLKDVSNSMDFDGYSCNSV